MEGKQRRKSEMNPHSEYAHAVDSQARAMLALAAKTPFFFEDCATDPGKLVDHWREQVIIEYVDSILDSALRSDENSIVEDDYGYDDDNVIGLFSPDMDSAKHHRIQVQFHRNSYTTQRNFTMLHELGHYLQQTNDDLADNICNLSSSNYNKRLEEGACNRFASLALLPDEYITRQLDGGPVTAPIIRNIFEAGRGKGKQQHLVRVSRPTVVHRMSDYLPDDGSIALIKNGKLERRVYGDGRIERNRKDAGNEVIPLTSNESMAIQRLLENENLDRSERAPFIKFTGENGETVTIDCSYYARDKRWFFVVSN